MSFLLVAAKLDVIVSFLFIPLGSGNAIKKHSFCKFSASWPLSSKKKTITMTIYVFTPCCGEA